MMMELKGRATVCYRSSRRKESPAKWKRALKDKRTGKISPDTSIPFLPAANGKAVGYMDKNRKRGCPIAGRQQSRLYNEDL